MVWVESGGAGGCGVGGGGGRVRGDMHHSHLH